MDRRARILAFSRKGSKTATIANLQEILSAWSDTNATITLDNPNYTVDVEFSEVGGIPPDIDFIQIFLRRIIPAHLDISYTFNFYTWGELRSETMTWAELRATGVTWAVLGDTGP
jgi:hypothetical protein